MILRDQRVSCNNYKSKDKYYKNKETKGLEIQKETKEN